MQFRHAVYSMRHTVNGTLALDDNSTIGVLLVKDKNQMVKTLLEELKSSLPSIEEIEKKLE